MIYELNNGLTISNHDKKREIPKKYSNNIEYVTKILDKRPWFLYQASEEIRDNFDFVKKYVEIYPINFSYLSIRLQDNDELYSIVKKDCPNVIFYASDRIKSDRNNMIEALENGADLSCVTNKKVDDFDIAIKSVNNNIFNYRLFNDELKNNIEILYYVKKIIDNLNRINLNGLKEEVLEKIEIIELEKEMQNDLNKYRSNKSVKLNKF